MITISSDNGYQCHVHGHILDEHASALYTSADWDSSDARANITVQASGDVLQLFTSWIYNGVIHLPEEHEENNNPLTFEATCQRALKDAQNGLPITAQHRWIKREGETSSVEGMEIPQLRMARLVDLYEFAHEWDIIELEQDILESFAVTLKVAQKLPRWDIVNKVCLLPGEEKSDLCSFIIDLFVENWSCHVSNSFHRADEEERNVEFASAVLYGITRQREGDMRVRKQDVLRAVTAEGKLKVAERELARCRAALIGAQKAVTTRQALIDAQAKTTLSRPVEIPAAKEIPSAKQKPVAAGKGKAVEKSKPSAKGKPAAKVKLVAKANPAAKTNQGPQVKTAANNKRPREEDEIDRSELFMQSLKSNCRELRPRISTLRLDE